MMLPLGLYPSRASANLEVIDHQEITSSTAMVDIVWRRAYDEVLILVTGLVPVTNNVGLMVRTSNDFGASFAAGASDYEGRLSYGFTTHQGGVHNAMRASFIGGTLGLTDNADQSYQGVLHLPRPFDASSYPQLFGMAQHIAVSGQPDHQRFWNKRDAAEPTNGLRFFMDSGNIAAARITAWGYRL